VPSHQRSQQAFQTEYVHQGDNPMALDVSNNLQAWQYPRTNRIDDIIEEASRKYGVEPGLIKAVISVESGGNPNALSPAGAQGLMQLMPKTAAELGVNNPLDPAENIMAGTRYLRQLLDRYWGNVRLALAAYNWGMGNLEKRPDAMPKETKNYIIKVENLYRTHLAASL
jgi:soluble lytic murein transglycosylase-like protein